MSVQIRVLRAMLLGAVLALGAMPLGAWAQTTGTTTTTSGQLTPRDQKIAQALFEAQTQNTGTNASKPLTLDQITTMKRHEGWGEIFKDMKAKGLLTQKNLGQVVKDFEKHHPELAKAGKSDKPDKVDKPTKPDHMDKPERPEKPGR
jgi:hypothetical protein